MPNTTFDASDTSDALNLAAAYIVKVTSKTNTLLEKLRKNQINSLNKLVQAAYASAKAMLYSAVFEGLQQFAMAAGGMSALKDADKAQDGLKGIQEKEKSLQTEKNTLENEYKKAADEDKVSAKQKFDDKTTELNKKTKERKAQQTTSNNKSQRATQKAGIINAAAPGIVAIPQAAQKTIQTQAEAVQTIMQQITSMLSTSYDKSNQVVQSFLNMNNLIGAIAGLSAIQLR